ncbi:MAG: diguanylate cyclase domain-containing protein [Dictyoglomaceae bacterium]
MTLKSKISLGSFLILLLFSFLLFISSFFISKVLIDQSLKSRAKDLRENFLYFLEQEKEKLEVHIKDYAYWEDMGELGVIKKDKEWLKDNLEPWVRDTFGYDLVALLKEDGEIITKSPFQEISLKDLLPKGLKIDSGFYITKKGVLIYSVSPVFDGYGKKYFHAFLIFGKIIDTSILKKWENILRFNIVVKTLDKHNTSYKYVFKNNYLCLSIPVNTKNGALEFYILKYEDMPSKISLSLQRSFLISLIFILILSTLLSNFVISKIFEPLDTFQKSIEEISKGKYEIKLDMNRNDEIGKLAVSFNRMTEKILEREKSLILAKELAEEFSFKDELTNIHNRRFLYSYTEYLINEKRNFALVFIDLDNFKNINDLLGHTTGDKVLREVAEWFRKNLRGEDKIIRYGGDEFCIILHDVDREKAEEVIKRLYLRFLEKDFLKGIILGFSYGIAIFPEDGENLNKLLAKADEKMYKMKENGERK